MSFITHFLKLCGVKMKDLKSFNISQRELENFCDGLKGNVGIQQQEKVFNSKKIKENLGHLKSLK